MTTSKQSPKTARRHSPSAESSPRASRSPLLYREWKYVPKPSLDSFGREDWELINAQRDRYQSEKQADHALRLLTVGKDDASFGYPVNMYRHALQAATMVMEAGFDEEAIVVSLLHDIGFIACPESHGEFAAALLRPYVSERNVWLLEHHAVFQEYHCHDNPQVPDRTRRERWRGHPHFEWTAEWVARYDQCAQDANYPVAPLETFEPMVRRVFARPNPRTT